MPAAKYAIVINPRDNVATSLGALEAGDTVTVISGETRSKVELADSIPPGHKLSLRVISRKSPVIKYGETIGVATEDIKLGEHVHIHNVASTRGRGDLPEMGR